jgi:hypothetical protein
MQKQIRLRALGSALRNWDLTAIGVLPLLSFGNGYHFAKGYLQGMAHGDTHCTQCRARLKTAA